VPGCCESLCRRHFEWNLHRYGRTPLHSVCSFTQGQAEQTLEALICHLSAFKSTEAGIMWNTSLWTLDLKWLTYQLTKWVRLHVSQAVWERGLAQRSTMWSKRLSKYADVHPFPQSASTHWSSTPNLCGSQPIRTFVHCYSNHGAHWGAHRVAMETASVYNSVKENQGEPYRLVWGNYQQGFSSILNNLSLLMRIRRSLICE